MEAFKNTSMMIILAGIFYGAYQMFVSEPPNWKKNAPEPSEVLMAADEGRSGADDRPLIGDPPSPPAWGNGDVRPSIDARPMGGPATSPASFPPSAAANPSQFGGPSSAAVPQELPSAAAWPPANRTAADTAAAGLPNALSNPGLPNPGLPGERSLNAGGAGAAPAWNQTAGVPPVGDVARPASFNADSNLGPTAPAASIPSVSSPAPVQVTGHHHSLDAGPVTTQGLDPGMSVARGANLLPISSGGDPPSFALTEQLKSAMETAATDIQAGDWTKALRELSVWYRQPLTLEDREHLVGWLDRLAGEVVYSSKHTLVAAHPVAAGETLGSIATRYQMPPRLLARINQFPDSVGDSDPLQPGVELKIVPGPFQAEAQLSAGQMTLYAGEMYAGRFQFVTGDSAPDEAIFDPISFVSVQGIPAQEDQRRHEPLAPSNPFGRFCLVVGQTAVLHSPGGNPQGSCLQFSEQDMQDLLILLPRGTTVRIVP